MYKQDLALNKLQQLICHKNRLNHFTWGRMWHRVNFQVKKGKDKEKVNITIELSWKNRLNKKYANSIKFMQIQMDNKRWNG